MHKFSKRNTLFVSRDGRSIVERTSKRSGKLKVAYVLVDTPVNPLRFEFFGTALLTARREYPLKLRSEFRRYARKQRGATG